MQIIRRVFTHCVWALLSLMITAVIVLGITYIYMELQLPDVSILRDMHLQEPLRIYTSDGKLIAEYGTKRRIPVSLNQVPQPLINAVLATEDVRFYSHSGVDFIGVLRAIKAVLESGRKVQGASTITMQVARNFFLTSKKTYSRKLKEILLALKIDEELSKDKILELYLNKVYFGNRAYGVSAAAHIYYGKNLNQLTLPQMAMIAGLPQAPSRNNPLNNSQLALKRRNHVLKRMFDVGFISKKTYKQAIKAPLTAKYHGQRIAIHAPYVAEMVRKAMLQEYGKAAYDKGLDIYTTISSTLQITANIALHNGLIAYTERHGYYKPTINLGWPTLENRTNWIKRLQKMENVDLLYPAAVLRTGYQTVHALLAHGDEIDIPWSGLAWAQPALKNGYKGATPRRASDIVTPGDVIWLRKDTRNRWRLSQIPKVQGAIIVLNPQNGAILALTGGFDYGLSKFNRAIQAQRQPGSNFKPFIYSAALEKGFTLASIINDAPVVMRDPGENMLWRPSNDTYRFYGPTRLRVGLAESRNLVSIRLLQAIGVSYALNYVRRFGFDSSKLPNTLSLALGSGTVTPLQIAVGYSVFANGGYRIVPHFIQRIIGQDDEVIYQAKPLQACQPCITNSNVPENEIPKPLAPQVLTFQNAYLMTQALQGVIQNGTGRAAQVLKRSDLAGKTGTTNQLVDAWFSGFNSKIEATVWLGFDDSTRSLHEYGAQAALPIWIQFMRNALQNISESTMPQPPGIVMVRIDPNTGLLANPDQQNAIFEVFRKQDAPQEFTSSDQAQFFNSNSSTNPSKITTDSAEPLF